MGDPSSRAAPRPPGSCPAGAVRGRRAPAWQSSPCGTGQQWWPRWAPAPVTVCRGLSRRAPGLCGILACRSLPLSSQHLWPGPGQWAWTRVGSVCRGGRRGVDGRGYFAQGVLGGRESGLSLAGPGLWVSVISYWEPWGSRPRMGAALNQSGDLSGADLAPRPRRLFPHLDSASGLWLPLVFLGSFSCPSLSCELHIFIVGVAMQGRPPVAVLGKSNGGSRNGKCKGLEVAL